MTSFSSLYRQCFRRNIKPIAVPPQLQNMKEIKEDKEFTENKPVFEKLLLMIDQPILIIRDKIKLCEEQHDEKV